MYAKIIFKVIMEENNGEDRYDLNVSNIKYSHELKIGLFVIEYS